MPQREATAPQNVLRPANVTHTTGGPVANFNWLARRRGFFFCFFIFVVSQFGELCDSVFMCMSVQSSRDFDFPLL